MTNTSTLRDRPEGPLDRQPEYRERHSEREQPSLGTLLGNLVGNIQELIRGEVKLARQEIKEEAQVAAVGLGLLGGAVALALTGLIFSGAFLFYLLLFVVPAWAAALLVAIVFLAGGGVLAMLGQRRLRQVNPVPRQTIASIKEDAQWVKQQMSSDESSTVSGRS